MSAASDPKWESIRPFLNLDTKKLYGSLTQEKACYILDNQFMTSLKKSIPDLPRLLQGMSESAIILIPEEVLLEAGKNLPGKERVEELYYDFFRELSRHKTIYVTALTGICEIVCESTAVAAALHKIRSIAIESVPTNPVIQAEIQSLALHAKEDVGQVSACMQATGRDGGERIVNLMALLLIGEYFGPIFVCSDDRKGIYTPYKAYQKNEKLREWIGVGGIDEFREMFQLMSFDRLLQKAVYEVECTQQETMELLRRCRPSEKNVLYSIDGLAENDELSHERFAELLAQKRIQITF